MQREVVTVSPDATVGEMLDLFRREGISGAPVVAEGGRVLGVVSLADVVRAARGRAERELAGSEDGGSERDARSARPVLRPELEKGSGFFHLPDSRACALPWADDGRSGPSSLWTVRVRDLMSPVPFHVDPDRSLREVARELARTGVHRVLVFEEGRLAGLTTTFDVLQALTRREG